MAHRFTLILALIPFLTLFTNNLALSQSHPLKWGNVKPEHLNMTVYDRDVEAAAVIINDYAKAEFIGNRLSVQYHIRIKILKTNGFSWGDVNIPYYSEDNIQSITGLRAQTVNYENGAEVKTKVASNAFFDADLGDGWKEKRFTFPDIKKGSIIEYQYSLSSKSFFYLRNWNFQSTIPTVHSEFRAEIPSSLQYNVIYQGKRTIDKYREKETNRWVLNHLPALKEEPYMTTPKNFMEMIRFQLAGYVSASGAYQDSGYKSVVTTWEALTKQLYGFETFGSQLSRSRLAQEALEQLSFEPGDSLQMLKAIYGYTQTHLLWNGDYSIYADGSLRKAWETGKTNSGGIGLFLTLLLQEAGFDAHPVLVSTRDHGHIFKDYPLLSQFNHLLVWVKSNGESLLLDATDPLRPYNLLAKNDLNGLGLVVTKKSHQWVDIDPPKGNQQTAIISADLTDLEAPKYEGKFQLEGFYALSAREKLKQLNETSFASSLLRTGLNLNTVAIDNQQTIDQPLKFDLCAVAALGSAKGNFLYLQPYLLSDYSENPFKAEERYYPIDFGSKSKETYIISITVPTGYQVEELPENALIKLPEDRGSFSYQCQLSGNRLQMMSKISIDQPVMHPLLYHSLKEFYNLIISKLGEQIVLKKL